MTESYHDAVAQHYAAFRPPLHRLILERVFPNQPTFRSKLDLGYALCATLYFAHYRLSQSLASQLLSRSLDFR